MLGSIWLNVKQYFTNQSIESDKLNNIYPPKNSYNNKFVCYENSNKQTCDIQNVTINPKWDTATIVLCQWNAFFCRNWVCTNSASNAQIPYNFDTTRLNNFCNELCTNPKCSTHWF